MSKNQILRIITALIFLLFACVQFNDPDSLIWIVVYIVTSIQSIISNKQFYRKWVDKLLIFLFSMFFISYIPSLFDWVKDGFPSIVNEMHSVNLHIEIVRESLGILLCIISIIYWRKR